jgi:hypothetical protein
VRLAVKIYSSPADLAVAMLAHPEEGHGGGFISSMVAGWQLGEGTGGRVLAGAGPHK